MTCPYCPFTARRLQVIKLHVYYAHDHGRAVKEINHQQVDHYQTTILKESHMENSDLIRCESCDNGFWYSECCNGADGCTCNGQPVFMGKCKVCGGTGWHSKDADKLANFKSITTPYLGSGPRF